MHLFTPKCNRTHRPTSDAAVYRPYSEYLSQDHWRQTKNKSSEIYGPGCVICRDRTNLNFHHLFYPKVRANICAHQVLPLCETCHLAYHAIAPNGGIYVDIKDPIKIANLIDEVFDYVDSARYFDFLPSQQAQIDRNKNLVLSLYWKQEGRRKKNRHHSFRSKRPYWSEQGFNSLPSHNEPNARNVVGCSLPTDKSSVAGIASPLDGSDARQPSTSMLS